MNSQDYWKKRAEEIAGDQFTKIDDYKVRMQLEYLAAIKSIQKEIQYFYLKFAQNNQISYVEALRLLKSDELEEFKMDLAEFTRKAKESKNEEWEKELNNVSYKVRITRLEALQTSINNSIENLFVKNEDNVTNLLKDIYEDTYHRNIFEIQKDTGVGTTFAKADDVALDNVISEKWKGSNYSERIWKDRDKLVEELKTNLSQSFIRGDSVDKTTKLIANRLDVDKSRARTLVNTESAYIAQKATFNGYEATGVEQYQIIATLDLHTSTLCRGLDSKIFNLSNKEIGVTAPPFHPNCRTTTVAYFEGMMFGERIARDSEGKVYYVDRNMTYKEWHDKYVKGNPKEEIAEKKIKNKATDKKQYEEYKNILGDDVPKSFDKFQELKYNDSNKWNELKSAYNEKYSPKVKRDGAVRAKEFSQFWQEESLKDTLNKILPEYEVLEKVDKGKMIYSNRNSSIQIVHDIKGNYFRIEDLNIKGKRRYLNINGDNVANKVENGKQKGRSKEEYEALTHFKNKDGDKNE